MKAVEAMLTRERGRCTSQSMRSWGGNSTCRHGGLETCWHWGCHAMRHWSLEARWGWGSHAVWRWGCQATSTGALGSRGGDPSNHLLSLLNFLFLLGNQSPNLQLSQAIKPNQTKPTQQERERDKKEEEEKEEEE